MFEDMLNGDFGFAPTNFPALILGLLLAFAGGHVLAWIYMTTHSGLSYSRSFVKSLIVMPVAVALVMHVLANNLITAFGMMAVFTIVRFRNMLRDTLDTTYILSTLALGMAAGTQKYASALIGCAVVCLVMLYLWYTSFGARHRYDVIVNLHWAGSQKEVEEQLRPVLTRHGWKVHLANQRSHEDYPGFDLSYRLLLRDPNRVGDLQSELKAVPGASRVSCIAAEDESEL